MTKNGKTEQKEPKKDGEFKNRMAAVMYLQDQGYKIKKSKLYKDCAAGILQVEKDGSVLKSAIDKYVEHPAAGLVNHMDTVRAGKDFEIRELSRKKITQQLSKEAILTEKYKFELEREKKQWVPRADFEMELASRAAVLDQGFRTMVRLNADDWIHLVGGRIAMAAQLKNMIFDTLDKMLTGYVSMSEFAVMFEEED